MRAGGDCRPLANGRGKALKQGRAECWFLMFLRTRKQKSKIDFALLDKSNKMVSGVKLILIKQNPRRLNTTQRLCIKTTMTTKQLQRRLYTPKGFLSSAPLRYGTRRRPTRDSHTWEGNAVRRAQPCEELRNTDRTIYTMDTAVLVQSGRRTPGSARFSCARRAAAAAGAPPATALSATPRAGRPSRCPSTLSVRPSSGRPFHPRMGTHGAARSSCRPHVGPWPSSEAVARLLSLPAAGHSWRCWARAACSLQGKAGAVSCWARVPRAGAAQPAVSPPARQASSGPPAPPLLPLTSAPQLALVSRLLLCSRPSSRSLSVEEVDEEEEDDEELRVRPECL